MPSQQSELLKGTSDLASTDFELVHPSRWKDGEKLVLFTRYNDLQKQFVAVGRLPATIDNIERVKELVDQTPDFQITVTAQKDAYAVGDPVVVRWKFKNVSPENKTLYTGPSGTSLTLNYDNMSAPSRDVNDGNLNDGAERKRASLTEVAAGETWVYQQTIKGSFPVGPVRGEWTYQSSDALGLERALPENTVLISQSGSFNFEVLPPTDRQRQELEAGIKSPRWNEQLKAAQQMLQTDDPQQWQKLEAFASHPYHALRRIGIAALSKKGVFTPELKKLFYQGAVLDPQNFYDHPNDLELAELAVAALEEEASERGFHGPQEVPTQPRHYNDLASTNDLRIGDILAHRLAHNQPMQGGVNNGLSLYGLLNMTDAVGPSNEPLSDALKAKVLAKWQAKRGSIKNPFTQAQLDAEIALARKLRYNDFKVGPHYAALALLFDEGQARHFDGGVAQTAWDKKVAEFPAEAAPDVLRLLEWRYIGNPPLGALQLLAKWNAPQVFPYLTRLAYHEGGSDGDSIIEAIRLMAQLDFNRSKTHLENFLTLPFKPGDWSRQAPSVGAALVFAARGEKRAVPVIFAAATQGYLPFPNSPTTLNALKIATGQDFSTLRQWHNWWQNEGNKQEWLGTAKPQLLANPAPPTDPIFPTTLITDHPTPDQPAPDATLALLQQNVDALNAALLSSDSARVLQLLAPGFELGQHEYRKRDLAWMQQALPLLLAQAKYTESSSQITGAEANNQRAISHATINYFVSLKDGSFKTNKGGNADAIWVKTENGWRLQRADAIFNPLIRLLPTTPVAPVKVYEAKIKVPLQGRRPDGLPRVRTLRFEDPNVVLEMSHLGPVSALAFTPEETQITTYDFADGLRYSSPQTAEFLKSPPTIQNQGKITSLTYAPDGTLITGLRSGVMRFWNPQDQLIKELPFSKGLVSALRVSPDGQTLAATGPAKVELWDIATGRQIQTLGPTDDNVTSLNFSPAEEIMGNKLVYSSNLGVEVWDREEGKLVQVIPAESWAGFLPDGRLITQVPGKIRIRTIGNNEVEREIPIPIPRPPDMVETSTTANLEVPAPNPLLSLTIAPNGEMAASIYSDGSIGLWEIETGQLHRLLRGFQNQTFEGGTSALAFSPDSNLLAVGSQNGEVAIWNAFPSTPLFPKPIGEKEAEK